VKVLQRWQEHLARVAPGLLAPFQTLAEPVCAALTAGASSPVLLHRDFYDKQVFGIKLVLGRRQTACWILTPWQ